MMHTGIHLQNHLKNFRIRLEYLLLARITNAVTSRTSFPAIAARMVCSSSFLIARYFRLGEKNQYNISVSFITSLLQSLTQRPANSSRAGRAHPVTIFLRLGITNNNLKPKPNH